MDDLEFDTTLDNDQGKVRIWLPVDPTPAWGKRSRHYIRGTINGTTFDGSLGTRNGRWFFPVNRQLQQRAGVGPGDQVHVVLSPAEPPQVTVPPDLAAALAGEPDAGEFFHDLSGFYQQQWVGWIESAKKPETRAARVGDTVIALTARRRQR